MAKVVRKGDVETVDLPLMLTEFRSHKREVAAITKRLDGVKRTLMEILERKGEPDEKGSLWIKFEGLVAGYEAIKRERRVKVTLDETKAEKILKNRAVWDQTTDVHIAIEGVDWPTVRELFNHLGWYDGDQYTVEERINDDKVMQLYYAEKNKPEPLLVAKDINAMFREDISWAFITRDGAEL